MVSNRIIAFYFVLVSILIIGFAIPLFLEIIPPNEYYGIIPDEGLDDDYYWYLYNKTAGIGLISGGLVSMIFSIILLIRAKKLKKNQIYVRGILFLIGGMILALLVSKLIISII